MVQIHIDGKANLGQAVAQFEALEKRVEALNRAMAKTALVPSGGNAEGYQRIARSVNVANAAYNSALASSGAWRVEQLKVNDEVARSTKLLQEQKLAFRETFGKRNRDLMRSIYQEQLRLQHAKPMIATGTIGDGRLRASLAIPAEVEKSWDSLSNRIGFFQTRLASASKQLINWGKNTQWAGRQLMAGLTYPIAAFSAAAAVMTYRLDEQLTRVAKVYDTTANQNSQNAKEQMAAERELKQVREAGMNTALDAAQKYGAAAEDTLSVQAELAATGLKGIRLQQSTSEVMRIATLGEIDNAVATKALISLQAVLGLNVKQTSDAFNYMNSVENATSLSTADFAKAIPIALGPMKEMGGNLHDLALLLVAMKQRGIEASQGANAIKAMMQRLYRPSKQVREEWEKIAHIDPMKLVQESGGNIMEILPKIASAVDDLNRPQRVQLLSGLFGTYQVTRMSAMLSGLEDVQKGVGQVSRVVDVDRQGWEAWGKTAENETKQRMQSISGRFQQTWRTLQVQMALIGEPFLEVADTFLKLFTAGAQLFNSMPDWAKHTAIIVALLTAAAGPTIMLIGLFANFLGNIGSITASTLKWATSFELLNKNQLLAKVSAKLAEREFMDESMAMQRAADRMEALTVAVNEYSVAMHKFSGMPLPPNLQQPITLPQGVPVTIGGRVGNVNSGPLATRTDLTKEQKVAVIRAQADELRKVEQEQHNVNQQALAENNIRQKSQRLVSMTAVSTGLMGASMAAMVVPGHHMTDEIAKWGMIGSIVLPAAKGMGVALTLASKKAVEVGKAQIASARGALSGAAATGRLAGRMNAARIAGQGLLAGMGSLMGPVGWTITAVAAIGAGILVWKNHMDEVYQKQVDANKSLRNMASQWSDEMGKVEGHYKTISKIAATMPEPSDFQSDVAAYRTGNLSGVGQAFRGLSEEDKMTESAQQFVDLQVKTGLTADQAKQKLIALWVAAGTNISIASGKMDILAAQIGNVKNLDWGTAVANESKIIADSIPQFFASGQDDIIKDNATHFAEVWSEAFQHGGRKGSIDALEQLTQTISQGWGQSFAKLAEDDKTAKFFQEQGITSGKTFWQWYQTMGESAVPEINKSLEPYVAAPIIEAINNNKNLENVLVGQIAIVNGLGDGVKTVIDLTNEWSISTSTLTYNDQKEAVRALLADTSNLVGTEKDRAEAINIARVNALNLARGFQQGETFSEAVYNFVFGVKDQTGKAADEADRLNKNLNGIDRNITVQIKADQIGDIMRSGMEGVMDEIASTASDRFQNRMSDAIDDYQSMWDDREQALSDRNDRQMDAFENRWERRKDAVDKYYDSRKNQLEAESKGIDNVIDRIDKQIETEQKAEEIRQRIFEAEQQRLERAAESANRGIDFNMALQTGDLDEAAKIRNDMEAAAAQWALSDAADAGSRSSDRRQNRLNRRKDRLADRKDRLQELSDQLDEERRRELDSLEKREDAERKHLERVQKMREDALKDQADAAIKAYQDEWDARKDNLDDQLELFKSFVPKNQQELKRWTEKMRDTYREFGQNTLDPMSQKWGNFFERSFVSHIREAGAKIATDNSWEGMGGKIARKLLSGFGFNSMRKFENFVRTGQLPGDFGEAPKRQRHHNAPHNNYFMPGVGSLNPNKPHAPGPGTYHGGGEVDGGAGSGRTGVARTLKGLHPSEQMIRAEKGEYIWDKKTTDKNRGLIEGIHKGILDPLGGRPERRGVMGGYTPGIAGLFSAAMGRMFAAGIAQSISNAYTSVQQTSPYYGAFGTAQAGKYGDITFDSEQLRNASIISSVGKSMGMSMRDIEIGIMTAITESALRNVNYGDRDSLGLFQQRPSQGWGTPAQVTNPEYAARKFFQSLKGITNRGNLSPWLAAQAVQRSAYSDGSNYRQYWDEALSIFSALRSAPSNGSGLGQFVQGRGGRHRPISARYGYGPIHDAYTGYPAVDFATGTIGHPVYAVADGRITRSYDITGYEPRNAVQNGYRSYGKVIYEKTDLGPEVIYAHLSRRNVAAGTRVRGGSIIGLSGNTGHSTGPHLHFGATNGPLAWLKNGGMTLNDGMAMLHRGETVLTEPLSDDLKNTVSAFGKISRGIMGGYTPDRYREGAGWTWLSGLANALRGGVSRDFANSIVPNGPAVNMANAGGSNARAALRLGTLNTKRGVAAAKTIADVSRLIGKVDVLTLMETHNKFGAIANWLRKHNWSAIGGKSKYEHEAVVAFNNAKYKLLKHGTRLLGRKQRNFIGGREPRYANFGLLEDRKTHRRMWQVAAHTVPTPNMNKGHRELFMEQWNNLDQLVGELRNTGAPVFLSGDLNNNPNRNWWRTPVGLKTHRGMGVDWIFSDPRYAKALSGGLIRGMHTDHAGAYIQNFSLPSHKAGAENIRWDNTLVNMHKKESILTAEQSDKFRRLANNIDNVASNGPVIYDVDVNITEPSASADDIANTVITKLERREARRPQRRTSR